eukprot:398022-Pleurochrysis_carterae.AAC.1
MSEDAYSSSPPLRPWPIIWRSVFVVVERSCPPAREARVRSCETCNTAKRKCRRHDEAGRAAVAKVIAAAARAFGICRKGYDIICTERQLHARLNRCRAISGASAPSSRHPRR